MTDKPSNLYFRPFQIETVVEYFERRHSVYQGKAWICTSLSSHLENSWFKKVTGGFLQQLLQSYEKMQREAKFHN